MADALPTSTPDKPTALTTASPPAPFRFSLLTLLSITTLAGLTSAVMFSKGWDPVERLLMAFWCAGLLLGASLGRARGKPGIFSAGLGSALGCLVATFMLHSGNFANNLHDKSLLAPFLMFVVCTGWILAVGVAAVYHALLSKKLESWWRTLLVRRTVYVFAALAVVGITAWQVAHSRTWKPGWELQIGFDNMTGTQPDILLSPQGNQLLVTAKSPQLNRNLERQAQLHELTARGVASRSFPLDWGHLAVFSPDGQQIATGRTEFLRVIDAESLAVRWGRPLELTPLEEVTQFAFSHDSRQLLVTTHTPRIHRLHRFDIASNQPPTRELFAFAGYLFVSSDGRRLIKYYDAEDENDERTVETVDLATRETICRLNDIVRLELPKFSLTGDRLAMGSRIWEVSSGQSRSVGANVVGLLSNGRALIVSHKPENRWSILVPEWLRQMPFVKHLHPRESYSRLSVIDEATGQTLLATPWLENLDHTELSANQRIVASTSRAGQIQIWKVPE